MDVAICSTGLIGDRLPMNELLAGVDAAYAWLSADGGDEAARAIMTTDSVPKQAVHAGDGFTVGGMAKGAGMLAPGLATMLAVVTTDAVVEPATLDQRAARGDRAYLRPGRLRRLHVDQRHRAAAGLRRLGHDADRGRARCRRARRLRRPVPASSSTTRRARARPSPSR